jgi:hypothetical protein
MTTLNKVNLGLALNISGELENKIIHEFNNGGVKSVESLSVAQRKALIKIIFSANAPKCFCIECL